jgi:hypothetical protein
MSNPTDPKLADSDLLNMRPFAERMESYMAVEMDYVEGSLVVSLAAPFGSGKTTFLDMWKESLIKRRENGDFVPMPISLNAWESDYCEDPMVAILSGLIAATDDWKGADKPNESKLKEAAKDTLWFALSLGNDVISTLTGLNPVDAMKLAESKKEERAKVIPDFIKLHQARTKSMDQLKHELEASFGGEELKVIVFVDELDRCRPDYAVTYLETIKHVFNIKGMAFVLAIDYDQLATSTKALYGESLRFEDYYRKFNHRTIRLPEPETNALTTLVHTYVKKYVSIEGKRGSGLNLESKITEIKTLAIALGVNLRQLQEVFRIMGHVSEVKNTAHTGQLMYTFNQGVILISMIRASQNELYNQIRKESIDPEEVAKKLIALLGKKSAQFWIAVYLSGVCPRGVSNPTGWATTLAISVGYVDTELNELSAQNFGHFTSGWSYAARLETQIKSIIEHIEGVDRFEKAEV